MLATERTAKAVADRRYGSNSLPRNFELPAPPISAMKRFSEFPTTTERPLWTSYREIFKHLEDDNESHEDETEKGHTNSSNDLYDEAVTEAIDTRKKKERYRELSKSLNELYVQISHWWNQVIDTVRKDQVADLVILSESLGRFTLWKDFLPDETSLCTLFSDQQDLGATTLKLLCSIARCLSRLDTFSKSKNGILDAGQTILEHVEQIIREEGQSIDKDEPDDRGEDEEGEDEEDEDYEDDDNGAVTDKVKTASGSSDRSPGSISTQKSFVESNLVTDIVDALDVLSRCLMELGPAIRRVCNEAEPKSQSPHYEKKQKFNFHVDAAIFASAIINKFPAAIKELANRLGEANWQRSKRIKIDLDRRSPVSDKDFSTILGIDIESLFTSSLSPTDSAIEQLPNLPDSYEPKRHSARFPPSPHDINQGRPFCCGICKKFVTDVKSPAQLRAHLLADLKPYICCNAVCRDSLVTFSTRKEWLDHETSHNRAFQFVTTSVGPREPGPCCPLCNKTVSCSPRILGHHIAHHLEWIAVTCLPVDSPPEFSLSSSSVGVGNLLTPPNALPEVESLDEATTVGPRVFPQHSSLSAPQYSSSSSSVGVGNLLTPPNALPGLESLDEADTVGPRVFPQHSSLLARPYSSNSSSVGFGNLLTPAYSLTADDRLDEESTNEHRLVSWNPSVFPPALKPPPPLAASYRNYRDELTQSMGSYSIQQWQGGSNSSSLTISSGTTASYDSGYYSASMSERRHVTSFPPAPNDRPFKCDQCAQSFNRNHDLKRHKRIHLVLKPYPCNHCDKSFSRKDALKRHLLVKQCGKVQVKNEQSSSKPESPSNSPASQSPIAVP